MTSQVIYKGDLRTQATHTFSGSVIETDAPLDNQGLAQRFSPTDLVATALATCMCTVMGIAARTHNIDIVGTTCDVEKIMAPNPRRISEIRMAIRFPAGKNYTDKEKALLEHTARTCPVDYCLHPDMKRDISFIWT